MLPKELLVGTIALGLVNHAYLKRYEPKTAHWPLACLLLQPFALVAALRFLLPSSGISPTTTSVLICTSAFLLTLVSSIVAYRLSPWHRLAHIPGPMHRKVTKLFTVVEAVMGRRHLVLKDLHERYGDVVRVGPNDVSIVNADAVKAVLGSGGLPKSDNYHVFSDATLSSRNLLSLSGPEHANRRRVWNRGMSSAALKDYEVLLQPRLELLMERLDAFAKGKQEVDLAQWLSYLPADFMGDIAFGGGFELLRDGEDRDGIYTLIKLGVKAMSIQAQIPWIAPTLNLVPAALEILRRLHAFGAARAAERMKVGPKTHKDLWYHLMDEEGHEKTPPKLIDVLTDGAMTIVAGSDTTAMSLTAFMYCMLTNREMYSRARTEVDNVYPDAQAIFDSEKHDELPFLTACMQETLRLYPVVPSGVGRRSPTGSTLHIGGALIPGDTNVLVPTYVLQRSPENFFPDPEKFDPERWLRAGEPEGGTIHNTVAFIPFSYGPANCAAKNLAWKELMSTAVLLLKRYEMKLVDIEGGSGVGWGETVQDYYLLQGREMMVKIALRE